MQKTIISEIVLTLLSNLEDSNRLRTEFPPDQTARQNHAGFALQPFRISLRRKQFTNHTQMLNPCL